MKLSHCLTFALSVFCFSSVAEKVKTPVKTFVITHVSHPGIEKYNQLIREMYQSIGYKVRFIPTPVLRGLSLVNDGIVDADSFRIKPSLTGFDNLITVMPPVKNLELILVCVKGVPCTRNVLQQESTQVISSKGVISLISDKGFAANIVLSERNDLVLDLLKAGRYYYATYIVDKQFKQKLVKEFNIVELANPYFYHVINKKHKLLLRELENKLSILINKLNNE